MRISAVLALAPFCCCDIGRSSGFVLYLLCHLCPQDIFKHCIEYGITSVTELPYFEGDFWPYVIEENIKELDQEAKEREASKHASVEVCRCRCVCECVGCWVCLGGLWCAG